MIASVDVMIVSLDFLYRIKQASLHDREDWMMTDTTMFENPILPGFYPDPSICRVGNDYYLVTSTFAYYPGVPIFHSRDLVNWTQIGHVLDRPSQLALDGVGHSHGVFAPTLRYYKGLFYMINTIVGGKGNFIVTAEKPEGPWSDPYWLADAPGIDPSLFFDEDGRAWFTGTADFENPQFYGDNEIYMRELDLATMQLTGPRYGLWRGALRDVVWAEGPHLYRIGEWYYLMISEAGTDYHHAVTIARSKSITGPYIGNPANPILTHRHLGRQYPIVNTGHADLVETPDGNWWMVCLASRTHGGYFRNLGRETFLVPVIWEDGWPIVSPGTGKIESRYPVPFAQTDSEGTLAPQKPNAFFDDFDSIHLHPTWNMIRTPREEWVDLSEKPSWLRLKLRPARLDQLENPSFLGRRQQHQDWRAEVRMDFHPLQTGAFAGMALVQSNEYHYQFGLARIGENVRIVLIRCKAGKTETIANYPYGAAAGPLQLILEAKAQKLTASVMHPNGQRITIAFGYDTTMLSTDVAGGFVGSYIGLYAEGWIEEYAYFDHFRYEML